MFFTASNVNAPQNHGYGLSGLFGNVKFNNYSWLTTEFTKVEKTATSIFQIKFTQQYILFYTNPLNLKCVPWKQQPMKLFNGLNNIPWIEELIIILLMNNFGEQILR